MGTRLGGGAGEVELGLLAMTPVEMGDPGQTIGVAEGCDVRDGPLVLYLLSQVSA
jgi:hypothetical protein